MCYLPLTDTDRTAMLAKIGATTVDDLFVDVPEVARLDGPIRGLPMHAGEMAVERHMKALAAKNMAAGDVRAPMFDVWLGLFDSVLRRTLPEATAAAWSALAHRIGRGMRMGVQDRDQPAGAPKLF